MINIDTNRYSFTVQEAEAFLRKIKLLGLRFSTDQASFTRYSLLFYKYYYNYYFLNIK